MFEGHIKVLSGTHVVSLVELVNELGSHKSWYNIYLIWMLYLKYTNEPTWFKARLPTAF